jgi:hypothetical protein
MAKHVESEQTSRVTELTADEMERVSGGLKFVLTDAQVTSYSLGGHDASRPPAN